MKQKELLKNAKSDSRAFCGPKAGKSAYFFNGRTRKKSAQITGVNTVPNHIQHYQSHGSIPNHSAFLLNMSFSNFLKLLSSHCVDSNVGSINHVIQRQALWVGWHKYLNGCYTKHTARRGGSRATPPPLSMGLLSVASV
jgi:hypothetical protein